MADLAIPEIAALGHHAAVLRRAAAKGDIRINHVLVSVAVLIPDLDIAGRVVIEDNTGTGIPEQAFPIGILAAGTGHDPPAVPVTFPPGVGGVRDFNGRFLGLADVGSTGFRRGGAALYKGHGHTHFHEVHDESAVLQGACAVDALDRNGDVLAVQGPCTLGRVALQGHDALAAGLQFDVVFAFINIGKVHGHTHRLDGRALISAQVRVTVVVFFTAGRERKEHCKRQQDGCEFFHFVSSKLITKKYGR